MENSTTPPLDEILEKLAELNTAITIYNQIDAEDIRNQAEVKFCTLYDWFTEHNISIAYIRQTRLYTLSEY